MVNYYCIYDNSLELANPMFAASDDQSAVRLCRNMLLSSTDDVFSRIVPSCDLRFVGSFDETTCDFVPSKPARLVCHLSNIPIPHSSGGDD